MACLGLGLSQNNLKLGQLFTENRFDCFGKGGGRLPRRVKVVSGGVAAGLKIDSKSSLNISMSNSNVSVRKKIKDKEDVASGKVDQWIRDSVQQIVNNIEEAPFLVHVFPEDDEGSRRSSNVKIVREKASANSWPNVKQRWERGSSVPNGIALVEELKDDVLLDNEDHQHQQCSSTKVFGIVIQERGLGFPVCYMLKTSRVRSISGICTHFCMFRVECFGETADVQFKKQWLL